MELTKKTTILFPPELHRRLARLAAERGTSLGELVRSACDREYGSASREEKLAARDALHAAVVLTQELDSICSFDRDFDLVRGLRRVEPR